MPPRSIRREELLRDLRRRENQLRTLENAIRQIDENIVVGGYLVIRVEAIRRSMLVRLCNQVREYCNRLNEELELLSRI